MTRHNVVYRDDTHRYRILTWESEDYCVCDPMDPPTERGCNGCEDEYRSAWEWSVDRLAIDYPGCDGHCIYGCGADPWETLRDNVYSGEWSDDPEPADTADEALRQAQAWLSLAFPSVRPEPVTR